MTDTPQPTEAMIEAGARASTRRANAESEWHEFEDDASDCYLAMTAPKHDVLLELAGGLTPPMWKALERLAGAYVWSDGRSCRALERRGLARLIGSFSDEMLGSFTSFSITESGQAVLALRSRAKGQDE